MKVLDKILKSEAERLQNTIEEIEESLQDIIIYLESDKFAKYEYVNKKDIILRVHEIKTYIFQNTDI